MIFLKRFGIFSSSNGRLPHNNAKSITPQLHTSTSGPAYKLAETVMEMVMEMEMEMEVVMEMVTEMVMEMMMMEMVMATMTSYFPDTTSGAA